MSFPNPPFEILKNAYADLFYAVKVNGVKTHIVFFAGVLNRCRSKFGSLLLR